MDRYITFNPEKFLRESKQWEGERKKLQKILESRSELPSHEQNEVRSGNIANPTQQAALDELRIKQEIERLNQYDYILNYGLSRLTDEEKYILHGFFMKKGYVNVFVDECCHKYDCKPKTVYNKRREAVRSFSRIVERIL